MSRMNQWFVLGDGIAREVITADIQRYLGPDALVRPGTGTGEYEGRPGYWITAYRTLTSQMIQDLKLDSQRWQAEKDRDQRGHGGGGSSHARETKVSRHPDANLVAYQDSRTHASRQHYGPSESYAPSSKSSTSYTSSYGASSESPHYTTTPQASYTTHQSYGQAPPSHQAHTAQQPRTDPYANYPQQAGGREYANYPATTPSYPYPQQPPQDPYGRPTVAPQYQQQATPSVGGAAPGYYIASDGRQYPLSQQPQPPQAGRRRGN